MSKIIIINILISITEQYVFTSALALYHSVSHKVEPGGGIIHVFHIAFPSLFSS